MQCVVILNDVLVGVVALSHLAALLFRQHLQKTLFNLLNLAPFFSVLNKLGRNFFSTKRLGLRIKHSVEVGEMATWRNVRLTQCYSNKKIILQESNEGEELGI
jgi:hypothetical protein